MNNWNQGRTQEIKDRFVHLGGDQSKDERILDDNGNLIKVTA